MALGRPVSPVVLNSETKSQIQSFSQSRSLPYSLVRRAQIILMAADGFSATDIARKVGLSRAMVGVWRKRFLNQGIMGLYDESKPGGPRSLKTGPLNFLYF